MRVLAEVVAAAAASPTLGFVALIDHMAHRECAPTRPGRVLLRAEVGRLQDLIDAGCMLLVAGVSFRAFFLLS